MANRIIAFMHCRQCLDELPPGVAPREWVRLECGWTPEGVQVWCVRHERNIVDLDFQGNKVVPLRNAPDTTH